MKGAHHRRHRRQLLVDSSVANASTNDASVFPPNSSAAENARFLSSASRQLSVSHMARAAFGEKGHGSEKGKGANHPKHSSHAKSSNSGGSSSISKAAGGAWHSVKNHLGGSGGGSGGGGSGGEWKGSSWGGSPSQPQPGSGNNLAMGPGDEADRLLGHNWCLPDHLVGV